MNTTGAKTVRRRHAHLALLIGTIVAANLLIGWLAYTTTREAVMTQLEDQLVTRREARAGALLTWMRNRRLAAEVLASRGDIRTGILALIKGEDRRREDLRATLQAEVFGLGFDGFAVVDRSGKVLVGRDGDDDHRSLVGEARQALLASFQLPSLLVPPKPDPLSKGSPPVILAFASIVDGESAVGSLVLGLDPRKQFSRLLDARGDALIVAFDAEGRLLNDLVPENPAIGADLPPGETPILGIRLDRSIPAVASALAGESGIHLDGAPDLTGRIGVGAWTWLEDGGFGMWTTLDHDLAMRPLRVVTWSILGIVALLTLGTALAGFWLFSSRILARRLARAQKEIAELGQYQMIKKLGEGGMGAVYLARHRLMRRETAVKLISGAADEEAIARFEREVRLCCQLSHPNTIQIYDYGRTADGTFYYAMERLRGADLEEIVTRHGPLAPERVIHILVQACGSLAEAHHAKLIHRDIKPANIYLCERGGLVDVVKVLDFGLVKHTEQKSGSLAVSQANIISGTPPYMAPEIIGQKDGIDGRSDLYALACVGYFLLTGRCVFEHANIMDTLMAHLNTPPTPPSLVASQAIPADLEAVIMRCLAKDPGQRPVDAEAFAAELERCAGAHAWTQVKARAWWAAVPEKTEAGDGEPSTDRKFMPTKRVETQG